MTEQKKEYLLDAFSELEDTFVAEAAAYTKVKVKRTYWRELAAAAACVVVLLVTAVTFRYLPMGKGLEGLIGKSEDSAEFVQEAYEEKSEETAVEVADKESLVAAIGANSAISESVVTNGTMDSNTTASESANGAVNSTVEHNSGTAWETIGSSANRKVYSQGYEWELIGDTSQDSSVQEFGERTECWEETKEATMEILQSGSSVLWKSAEEILAEGRDIFLGTVANMRVYHATGASDQYFTVATIEVEDCIRGELMPGQICRIYFPLATVEGMVETTSISGELGAVGVGSRAVFMPRTASQDTGVGDKQQEQWLCYADFADYYYSEGRRYLFLETEEGVSYADEVYQIPGGDEVQMEDVVEYLRETVE